MKEIIRINYSVQESERNIRTTTMFRNNQTDLSKSFEATKNKWNPIMLITKFQEQHEQEQVTKLRQDNSWTGKKEDRIR